MYVIPPKRICLSGGGIRAVAFLGALELLQEKGLLRCVKEYVGISAGAFICFGICIGYTLEEMKQIGYEFDFSHIRSVNEEAALEFLENYGIDTGENLIRLFESILKQKGFEPEITFEQFYERKPDAPLFRCYATDLVTCLPREFSVEATPDVSLVKALRATMSLPLYFSTVEDPVTGHHLTDGAVLDTYPMAFLSEAERTESLGFVFSNTHVEHREIHEPWDFLQQMLACIYLPRARRNLKESGKNTVVIPNGDFPSWNFEASTEQRKKLAQEAADATQKFLETFHQTPKITRRYSAC